MKIQRRGNQNESERGKEKKEAKKGKVNKKNGRNGEMISASKTLDVKNNPESIRVLHAYIVDLNYSIFFT